MAVCGAWQSLSGCNSRQKTTGEKSPATIPPKMDPSTISPPPRPTDDLGGFEPRTSVTGIQAEAFRKKAYPLGYCASGLVSVTNVMP